MPAVQAKDSGRTGSIDRTVILVEDDCGLRDALARVLQAAGFTASGYGSAEAALDDDAVDAADCLVIDLGLPVMSGLDLIDRLRGRGLEAPIIVITARDEPRIREEIRRRSLRHFLAKPFLGSALVDAVGAALAEPKGRAGH